jgi:hypothetical protein
MVYKIETVQLVILKDIAIITICLVRRLLKINIYKYTISFYSLTKDLNVCTRVMYVITDYVPNNGASIADRVILVFSCITL